MKFKKPAIGVGLAAAMVLVAGVPASAHVTIAPNTATSGGYGYFAFHMPDEEDNANSTQLEVDIPTDTPLAYVGVQPTEGWTYEVTNTTLAKPLTTDDGQVTQAVSKIVWKATGDGVKPGEFAAFNVAMGPFPSGINQLEFKALQTYSNGDVVRWIDETPANGPEPEHPAPILKLTAATSAASASANANAGSTTVIKKETSGLSVAALIVSIVAIVFAAVALPLALRRKQNS